jgi:hypothetical protein
VNTGNGSNVSGNANVNTAGNAGAGSANANANPCTTALNTQSASNPLSGVLSSGPLSSVDSLLFGGAGLSALAGGALAVNHRRKLAS